MEALRNRSRSFGATEGCVWLSRAGARGAKLWRCFKHGVLGVHSGYCNQSQRRLQRFRIEDSHRDNDSSDHETLPESERRERTTLMGT